MKQRLYHIRINYSIAFLINQRRPDLGEVSIEKESLRLKTIQKLNTTSSQLLAQNRCAKTHFFMFKKQTI